jgi:hypothetical protein
VTKPELVFRDPPPWRRAAKTDWASVARQLMDNPGRWAMVLESAPFSTFSALRNQDINALKRARGFSYVTRRNKVGSDGRRYCDIYIRFDPPTQEDEDGHAPQDNG